MSVALNLVWEVLVDETQDFEKGVISEELFISEAQIRSSFEFENFDKIKSTTLRLKSFSFWNYSTMRSLPEVKSVAWWQSRFLRLKSINCLKEVLNFKSPDQIVHITGTQHIFFEKRTYLLLRIGYVRPTELMFLRLSYPNRHVIVTLVS